MSSTGDRAPGMKSAYELALERLESQGIERPDEGSLTDEVRREMADVRSRAEAAVAQLEILHRGRLGSAHDPIERDKLQEEYQLERRRIEDRRDRDLERLRESSSRP